MKNRNDDNVAIKAGIWYVVSSIFVKSVVFLTTPIFTRILTTEEYGTVAIFSSWYSVLLPIFTLNLGYSIGRAKLDFPNKLDEYIYSMQTLAICFSVGFSLLVLLFVKQIAAIMQLKPTILILLLLYLIFTPPIQFEQNGYRYRYQYKQNIAIAAYMAIANVVISLFLFSCFRENKVLLRVVSILLPTVGLSAFFWYRKLKSGKMKTNKAFWKYGISISLPMVFHVISLNILSQADRIFISVICGAEQTGVYSLMYTYGLSLSVILNAVADGWLPWFHDNFFAGNKEKIRKNTKLIVGFACYVCLACIAFAPEAVMVLGGSEYLIGLECIPPIVLGILCQTVYTHYVNIELHLKKTKYVAIGTIMAAIMNILLNAIYIPRYGMIAAAYTTLISYVVLLFLHYGISRFLLKVHLYQDKFMFGVLIIVGLLTRIIQMSYHHLYIRGCIIAAGMICFIYSYKNFITNYIKKALINKKSR